MRTVPVTRAMGLVSCIRLKQRKNVLLPQPDGPISAVTRRSVIGIFKFFSACFAPYQKLNPSTDALICVGAEVCVSPVANRGRGARSAFFMVAACFAVVRRSAFA